MRKRILWNMSWSTNNRSHSLAILRSLLTAKECQFLIVLSQIHTYSLTRSFPNTIFASYITFLCSFPLPHPNLLPLITHFKTFTCILPPSLNLLQCSCTNTPKEISVPSTNIFSNFDPYFLCSLTRQYHPAPCKLPSAASPKPCTRTASHIKQHYLYISRYH